MHCTVCLTLGFIDVGLVGYLGFWILFACILGFVLYLWFAVCGFFVSMVSCLFCVVSVACDLVSV